MIRKFKKGQRYCVIKENLESINNLSSEFYDNAVIAIEDDDFGMAYCVNENDYIPEYDTNEYKCYGYDIDILAIDEVEEV